MDRHVREDENRKAEEKEAKRKKGRSGRNHKREEGTKTGKGSRDECSSSECTLFPDGRSMHLSPQPLVREVGEHGHIGPFVLRFPI